MAIKYETDDGIIKAACVFYNTIIPMVLDGVEFWFLLFFCISCSVSQHLDLFHPEDYNAHLPWSLTGITGSLMTFFVCFYNGQQFDRYNRLYDVTKGMSETCLELISVVKVHVPHRKDLQRKVARLAVASIYVWYYERTNKSDGVYISHLEFGQLKKTDLLNDSELVALREYCGRVGTNALPSMVLLQWAMAIMRTETPTPEVREDMLGQVFEKAYKLRELQAEVEQIMGLPMPFQYYHIMNMMMSLNLFLWAYALGCQSSYWAPVIYTAVQALFQGLRELSTCLSDPYGTDEVDFPINDWMRSLYRRAWGILEDPVTVSQLSVGKTRVFQDPEIAMKKINLLVDVSMADAPYPDVFGELKTKLFDERKKLRSIPVSMPGSDRDLDQELHPRREQWSQRALLPPEQVKRLMNVRQAQ